MECFDDSDVITQMNTLQTNKMYNKSQVNPDHTKDTSHCLNDKCKQFIFIIECTGEY